ncbi:VCBS repeat-containing protein [Streptomyces sp. KM273126]|uniref:FG-GAP repeat domain-containing protein n=1 Tax=Streptomyces sp. KM273126 TaxID=2545247 RepID=UPI00103C18DA|nr:FG-GAP and VCBS repeat-containing protein [Streptomyces sp. KM273126]MBA2807815.1 VCBS repeat-containing protein [Streptomyces sp. KM273126]
MTAMKAARPTRAKVPRGAQTAPAHLTRRRVTALLTAGLLLAATACTADAPGTGTGTDRRTTARPPAGTPASSPKATDWRTTARPAAGTPASSPKDLDTGDFNGDGYDDYAGYVRAYSKGQWSATHLVIVYGSAKGLRPEWSQRYTDIEGGWLFRADLDGDGHTDLIEGKSDTGASAARVWWGGPRGLSAPEDLAVPKDTRLLAVADFDGDGRTDLLDAGFKKRPDYPEVRDATGGRMLLGPFGREGAPARTVPLDLGQDGWATPGHATTGDFDGDGHAEVLLHYQCGDYEEEPTRPCHPLETREGAADGGLPAAPALEAALSDPKLWSAFDGATDVGDADADGLADLLLWNTISSGDGAVRVLYGARAGLGTGRDTATVASDLGNSFGARAAVGDMTGDGRPDLLISAPNFRNHDGRLTLVPGTSDGSPAPIDGATSMDSTTEGLPGTRNPYEWNDFTADPPLLDVNGDDHDDAVLFLPLYEKRKGMFLVVYGTDNGLAPDRTAHFTPADVGVSRSL